MPSPGHTTVQYCLSYYLGSVGCLRIAGKGDATSIESTPVHRLLGDHLAEEYPSSVAYCFGSRGFQDVAKQDTITPGLGMLGEEPPPLHRWLTWRISYLREASIQGQCCRPGLCILPLPQRLHFSLSLIRGWNWAGAGWHGALDQVNAKLCPGSEHWHRALRRDFH